MADVLAVHVGDGVINLKKMDLGNLQPDTRTCKWFHGCCTQKISFSISPVSQDGQHQLPAVSCAAPPSPPCAGQSARSCHAVSV